MVVEDSETVVCSTSDRRLAGLHQSLFPVVMDRLTLARQRGRPQRRLMGVVCSHAEDARAIDAAVRWRQVICCGNPLNNSQK